MHPRLLEIPSPNLTIGSYGPMMVLGFLAALLLTRRLSQRPAVVHNPVHILA
ncbi:MAG: hypothetical protein JW837_16895 [Sedimentisphaerales bacterium]|nr:hypothetical protein [Sedimentisphaerales bacterium]